MYLLQAKQHDGTWATISEHDDRPAAIAAQAERAGYRRRTVEYRVIGAAGYIAEQLNEFLRPVKRRRS